MDQGIINTNASSSLSEVPPEHLYKERIGSPIYSWLLKLAKLLPSQALQ